jgi:hypothetical protein
MKSLLLCSLMIFTTQAFALGQLDEPKCGEPCTTCPSGIKECKKYKVSDNREAKVVDRADPTARRGSRKGGSATKQQ